MDTLVGQTLRRYKIVQQIGTGGMGVVYRARDLDLERDVAVKFLPSELISSPERLAMFRTEAKALASLNHPNIASIYRIVNTKGGGPFLVLELIEGTTLAARLREGTPPLRDALDWCAQIAEALEAAHHRGVVHRDLKPGNVMISPGGRVKILDFGLARRGVPQDRSTTTLSTISRLFPDAGLAAGTAGYASPEQIFGQEQDARTDIFAFGCVLYECLTGRRAFGGASKSDVLAATLSGQPDWGLVPAEAPSSIRELIEHCLQKEPEKRLHDIGVAWRCVAEARGLGDGASSYPARAVRSPHNLPHQLSVFVGRHAAIAECKDLLARTRFVSLLGPGGCGKTRLALRVASEVLNDHPDGVWFVDLAPLSDGARVAQAVAAAMGIQGEPGEPVIETIARRVRNQRALVLLDNCEHLLRECGAVAQRLLHSGASVRVMATSRELLGIPGECAYPVRPLQTPPAGLDRILEAVENFEAVRLFVERAKQVAPGFALSPETTAATAEICRKLDGMPLAIELAAARTRVLSVNQICSRLEDRFRLLTGGTSGHERHQTLEATIQWSYDLLDASEQRLLCLLSTFAGGCTLEAATFLVGEKADEFEILDSLTRLVDKSLVGVEHAEGEARYSMLETLRQYAQSRLAELGETDEARTRHLEFYLALAEQSAERMVGGGQATWFARLDRELENMLLALGWCEGAPTGAKKASRLVRALSRHWISRGLLELGLRATSNALRLFGPGSPNPDRGLLTVSKGEFNYRMGRYREAAGLGEEGLAIARHARDKSVAERALRLLANVTYAEGNAGAAREHFNEALGLAREIGEPFRLCSELNDFADFHRAQGAFDAALPLYEEALAIVRKMKDRENIAVVLANTAQLLITCGDTDRARSNLIEVFAVMEETSSKLVGHILLDTATGLAARMGDAAEAARLYGATEAVMERDGSGRPHADKLYLEPLLAIARERLGASDFARAEAEGRALSLEEGAAEAGRWLLLGPASG